jgi:hypothetical protein
LSKASTAAVAIWGSSIGRVIEHRLLPPYHSGISQLPTRKNYGKRSGSRSENDLSSHAYVT